MDLLDPGGHRQTTRFGPYYPRDIRCRPLLPEQEALTIAAIPTRRLGLIRVIGPSMVPALRHGDTVLVRRGARIRPGDVVLARFRSMPERLVVKRAVHASDGGWWLASENRFAGGDSTTNGVADVLGRVVLRVRPGLPRPIR